MILSPQNVLVLLLGTTFICSRADDTCPDIKLMGVGESDKLAILRGCPGTPGQPGLQGPAGPTGQKGDKGSQGITGDRGLTGQKGDQGAPGTMGDRGLTGEKGSKGDRCELSRAAKNCKDLKDQGIVFSGWYTIYPDGMQPLMVLCDMTTDGGGWIVFQRRVDGSVDFYQDWETYKKGFGNQATEFWLGNENIHRLTSGGYYQLRVDLEDFDNNRTYATYSSFSLNSGGDFYRLKLGEFLAGTAGDSLGTHKDEAFSTKDKDNDKAKERISCAEYYKGAWWFKSCYDSHLNGEYFRDGLSKTGGIKWLQFRDTKFSLKFSEMKFRPV